MKKNTRTFFIVICIASIFYSCKEDLEQSSISKSNSEAAVIVYNQGNSNANSTGRIVGDLKNGFINRDLSGNLHSFVATRFNSFFITRAANFLVGNGFFSGQPNISDFLSGDFNGDGYTDLLCRFFDGTLRMYYWDSEGKTYYGQNGIVLTNAYFSNYLVADFNGDKLADLIVRDSNGGLYFYPWNNGLGFSTPIAGTQVGNGFNFTHFFVADWNGDGTADLICRDNLGRLRFYPFKYNTFYGNGGGTIVGNGFNFQNYFVGEFTGDNLPDLVGRISNGNLLMYPFSIYNTFIGNGGGSVIAGGITQPYVFFGDWSGLTGFNDIIAVKANGLVDYYQYNIGARLVTSGTPNLYNWEQYVGFLPGRY